MIFIEDRIDNSLLINYYFFVINFLLYSLSTLYFSKLINFLMYLFPTISTSNNIYFQECLTSGNLQDRIKFVLKGEQQQGGKLNWVQKSALDKARLSENTSFQKVLLAKVSIYYTTFRLLTP